MLKIHLKKFILFLFVLLSTLELNAGASTMLSPTANSTLATGPVTFQWEDVNASNYGVYIGTSVGSNDLYSTGILNNTITSLTLDNPPSNTTFTVYVRLWSNINGTWQSNDYQYTIEAASTTPAVMLTPTAGSTLTSSTVDFQWQNINANNYGIYVGTTQGANDIFSSGILENNVTSLTVNNLPTDGSTLYVTLWSNILGSWYNNTYTYIASSVTTEQRPLLIIRIEFNDFAFSNSASVWHSKIFGSSSGELNDYYNEISYGKFQFTEASETEGTLNDGIVTVQLNENHPGNSNVSFLTELNSAIAIANNSINFATYDSNGNGAISKDELQIMFLVAGGESATGAAPGVWAHAWCMYGGNASAPTHDGVRLMNCYDGGGYSRFGEKHFNALSGSDASIGIIAHELGHAALGLPDLYDTDGGSEGIGKFGLMGSGNWASKPGDTQPGQTPVHMIGWSKTQVGFVNPTIISSNTNNLNVEGTSSSAYTLYKVNTGRSGEYFLFENREANGYDMGLSSLSGISNYTGGLSILHIDENQAGNQDETHKLVDVEEANNAGLDAEIDRGHINNLFFSGNSTAFTPLSNPNSNRYDGNSTNIYIDNISATGTTMTLDVSVN